MVAMMSQLHVSLSQTLDEAFPKVDPGVAPYGGRVLLQVRTAKGKTRGGIILTTESRETILWNTTVAKVVAIGPMAFKDKATQVDWPEGSWAEVGDFVKCPKYGGDRWQVDVPGQEEPALFVIVNDHELIGKVTGDPLALRAYV